MKKIDNKGFMLVEILICATVIVAVLVGIYVEFTHVKRSYDDSFSYNNVVELYLAKEARNYILENEVVVPDDLTNEAYIELGMDDKLSCAIPICSGSDTTYCRDLFSKLKISRIVYAKAPLDSYSTGCFDKNNVNDKKFEEFIKKFKLIKSGEVFYFEFENGTFAALKG